MTGRQIVAGVVGGIVLFVMGFLLYGLAFMGFFEANAGSATGVYKEVPTFWALGLGQLLTGIFLALILARWPGARSFAGGLKVSLGLGLLLGFAFDLTWYGTTNIMNLTGTLVDPFVLAVEFGVAGGVIGAMLPPSSGRGDPAEEPARTVTV